MVNVPTFDTPYYSQVVTLDGRDFVMDLRFNEREACWYLSLATSDGTDLCRGIKVVGNSPLLYGRHADPRMPQGELLANISGPDTSPPGFSELGSGKRAELIYVEAAEYLALVRAAAAT